jgi:hypothetical protein
MGWVVDVCHNEIEDAMKASLWRAGQFSMGIEVRQLNEIWLGLNFRTSLDPPSPPWKPSGKFCKQFGGYTGPAYSRIKNGTTTKHLPRCTNYSDKLTFWIII